MKKTLEQIEQEMREHAMVIISKAEGAKYDFGKEEAKTVLNGIIQYLQEQHENLF